MGIVNKLLGGSTLVLTLLSLILGYSAKNRKETLLENKTEIKMLRDSIAQLHLKNFDDSLSNVSLIRETQSVLQQVNNQNKSLKRENTLLRKGVRLDLLTIRQRRNGKTIDSVLVEGYKYLDK